jgi:hypothetical protein
VCKLSFDGMEGRLSLLWAARKPVAGSRALKDGHTASGLARRWARTAALLIAPRSFAVHEGRGL